MPVTAITSYHSRARRCVLGLTHCSGFAGMGRVDGVIPRFSTALNNARVRNTLGYAGSCNGNRRNRPGSRERLARWRDPLTPPGQEGPCAAGGQHFFAAVLCPMITLREAR